MATTLNPTTRGIYGDTDAIWYETLSSRGLYFEVALSAGNVVPSTRGVYSIGPTLVVVGAGAVTRKLAGGGQLGTALSGFGSATRRSPAIGGSLSVEGAKQASGGGNIVSRRSSGGGLIARAQRTGWFANRYHI